MKWGETITSQCRYSEIAETIWGDWNIIWERAEADYQGGAEFLAEKDGVYSMYEWTYGSCSGCDQWEDQKLSDEDIRQEMQDTQCLFSDETIFINYLDNLEKTDSEKAKEIRNAFLLYKHPTLVPFI